MSCRSLPEGRRCSAVDSKLAGEMRVSRLGYLGTRPRAGRRAATSHFIFLPSVFTNRSCTYGKSVFINTYSLLISNQAYFCICGGVRGESELDIVESTAELLDRRVSQLARAGVVWQPDKVAHSSFSFNYFFSFFFSLILVEYT